MKSGIAFHCHHDKLWEWVYDFEGRVEFIKGNKPAEEQELRLKLLRLIPPDKVPLRAGVSRAARDKAWAARDKARTALDKARAAYDNLIDSVGMEALHQELCPECPWDGKTIFRKKKD